MTTCIRGPELSGAVVPGTGWDRGGIICPTWSLLRLILSVSSSTVLRSSSSSTSRRLDFSCEEMGAEESVGPQGPCGLRPALGMLEEGGLLRRHFQSNRTQPAREAPTQPWRQGKGEPRPLDTAA